MPPETAPAVGSLAYCATVTAPTPVPLAEMLLPGSDAVAVPLALSEAAPLDCVAPGGGAGGCGPALGVTEFDGAEGELGPWELVAVTVKV